MKQAIGYILFVISVVVFSLIGLKQCNKNKSLQSTLNAVTDTLHQSRLSDGSHVATIANLNTSVSQLKSLNAGKDSTIQKLQQLVDKKTQVGIVSSTVTKEQGTTKSQVSLSHKDSQLVKKDSNVILVYPTYRSTWKTKWDSGSAVANKDSFTHHYIVFNEYTYKIENNSTLFKTVPSTISMHNLNPNTLTTELRSITVPVPKPYRVYWLASGAIIGILATIFLIK